MERDKCDNCEKEFNQWDFILISPNTIPLAFCSYPCLHEWVDEMNIQVKEQ